MAVYKASNSGLLTRREYTSFLAGNTQFVPNFTVGAFDSIATTTLATTTTSITFSSIPSTYTHLQIRGIFRSTSAGTSTNDLKLQFNSDTAGNYSQHYLYSNGSSVSAGGQINYTYIPVIDILQDGNTANVYASSIIDILDYANTSKFKTTRTLNGWDANGSGELIFGSGNWRSTSAITSITLGPSSGNMKLYSSFALYGIKGA